MTTHTIKLMPEIQVSLAVLNKERFLIISNSSETRYVFVEPYIIVQKKDDFLILENNITLSTDENLFTIFVNKIDFVIKNLMVIFKKKLLLKGLGFRCNVNEKTKTVEFKLGFSHLLNLTIPENIKMIVRKSYISIESSNNVLLGNFLNKIISLKKPDSYKGKGF
jgi:ribosomal protein L6P/L9E